MADEYEIQDDEDKTLSIDDADGADAGEEEAGGEEIAAAVAPIAPPKYKPDSNVYTVMLVLSFLAYAVSLGLILAEMRDYCDPMRFMWGAFK